MPYRASLPSHIVAGDDVDPELASLPRRRDWARLVTLALLALGAATALALALSLRHDVAYVFAARPAEALGDLRAVGTEVLARKVNRFVAGEGSLGLAGAVRYERPFQGGSFRVAPVMGRRDLWVELQVAAGEDSGRWQPPPSFEGRLERLDRADPHHRGLKEAIEQATGIQVPPEAWLVVAGEAPGRATAWVLALVGALVACAAGCGASMLRILRRISA